MRVFVAVCLLSLSGCATGTPVALSAGQPFENPPSVFEATRYSEDPHRALGQFLGPNQVINSSGNTRITWRLRSFEPLNGNEITHQIYIILDYRDDWRFYRSAATMGVGMPVREISRDVVSCRTNPCSLREHIAIDFPDDLMSGLRLHGLAFAIYGRGHSHEIQIPAEYVDGYMRRVRGI